MKLPEKIKGRNKVRDAAIVLYFKRDHLDFVDLSIRFKLTEMRIRQILQANHAFIPTDKEWEKTKRVHRLHRWMKTAPEPRLNKLDYQRELRAEIEGDGNKSGQGSGETRVIIIRSEAAASNPSDKRETQIELSRA